MITVSTKDLPSRGYLYTQDTIDIKTFGINELMLLSSAIETQDDTDFVAAVQGSISLAEPLTIGDFYYIAALQRILSYKSVPIEWSWRCAGDVLEVTILEPDDDLTEYLVARGYKQTKPDTWNLYQFNEADLAQANKDLVAFKGKFAGLLRDCGASNHTVVDRAVLDANMVPLTELPVLLKGYEFPRSTHIAEYTKLYSIDSLRKLLPLVVWLDASYGKTLEDRINTLKGREDAPDILDQAAIYDLKYQHGYSRDITCTPCTVCGSQTSRQRLAIAARSFYR